MKSAHNPRPLVILILILIAVAFLTGILRVFRAVQVAASPVLTPTVVATDADTDITPAPAQTDMDLTPRPVSKVVPVSADTTGIIALAIVIVATILLGATWGVRNSPQKKIPPK